MPKKPNLVSLEPSRDERTQRLIVEHPLDGFPGWNMRAEIDDSGDQAHIVAVCIGRQDPANSSVVQFHKRDRATGRVSEPVDSPLESVTTQMLRAIKINDLTDTVNRHLEYWVPKRVPDPAKQRANSPKYYASWAARYVKAVRVGSRSPIADLATDTGKTREQVRDTIHRCRALGYLTTGKKGLAAGELTQKAIDALGGAK